MGSALKLRSRLLLGGAAVAVVLATVVYVTRTTRYPAAVQIGGAASGAFDRKGELAATVERALFSPDGNRLAVVTSDGIGVAERGTPRLLTPPGSKAVDAAWAADSASVLVGEGPADADRLTLLALDGTVKGVAHLDQPFSLGAGNGMTVNDSDTLAVATSETRDPIGGHRHYRLMLVELATGHVSVLTTAPDVDEAWPVFAGDSVVFAQRRGRAPWQVEVLAIKDGSRRPLSPNGEEALPVGVLHTGQPVYAGGRPGREVSVWAIADDGSRVRLGQLPPGARVWSIEPGGTRAVVSEIAVVGGQPVKVTRAVTLHGLETR